MGSSCGWALEKCPQPRVHRTLASEFLEGRGGRERPGPQTHRRVGTVGAGLLQHVLGNLWPSFLGAQPCPRIPAVGGSALPAQAWAAGSSRQAKFPTRQSLLVVQLLLARWDEDPHLSVACGVQGGGPPTPACWPCPGPGDTAGWPAAASRGLTAVEKVPSGSSLCGYDHPKSTSPDARTCGGSQPRMRGPRGSRASVLGALAPEVSLAPQDAVTLRWLV